MYMTVTQHMLPHLELVNLGDGLLRAQHQGGCDVAGHVALGAEHMCDLLLHCVVVVHKAHATQLHKERTLQDKESKACW